MSFDGFFSIIGVILFVLWMLFLPAWGLRVYFTGRCRTKLYSKQKKKYFYGTFVGQQARVIAIILIAGGSGVILLFLIAILLPIASLFSFIIILATIIVSQIYMARNLDTAADIEWRSWWG